jgi:hypothetical protein
MVQNFTNNGALGAIVGIVVASNSRNITMYSDPEEFDRNLLFYRPTYSNGYIEPAPEIFCPTIPNFPGT